MRRHDGWNDGKVDPLLIFAIGNIQKVHGICHQKFLHKMKGIRNQRCHNPQHMKNQKGHKGKHSPLEGAGCSHRGPVQ